MQPTLYSPSDWRFDALSTAIAACASYLVLSLARNETSRRQRKLHLAVARLLIGAGIAALCLHHPAAAAISAFSILVWSPRASPTGRAVSRQALKHRPGAYDMEYRRLCQRDGSWRWILAPRHAVWDKNGCDHTT